MTDPFLGTSGPRDADIMIVGEAYGKTEAEKLQPFVGESGKELTRMLAEAGIDRNRCFLTNVVNTRPPSNDMKAFFMPTAEGKKRGASVRGLYPRDVILEGIQKLYTQIEQVSPKIIIAFGNYSLWALTHDCFKVGDEKGYKVPRGIGSWRGSQLYSIPGPPLLPTYHPAAIMRQWAWRAQAVHDLRTRVPLATKTVNGWDDIPRDFLIAPTYDETIAVLDQLIEQLALGPLWLASDLETKHHYISCAGLAWEINSAICIPFMHSEPGGYWNAEQEYQIIRRLRYIHTHPNVRLVGQNFLYDMQHMHAWWFCKPQVFVDTLVWHHLCYPGTPRGLDYLSSMYCSYHRYWKDEGKEWHKSFSDEQHWTYNCRDVVATLEIGQFLHNTLLPALHLEHLESERRDILHMTYDMMLRGVKVNTKLRGQVALELAGAIEEREMFLDRVIPPDILPRKKGRKPWYNSPTQQMELFYDIIGLKEITHRKSGNRTVNDEALEKIWHREPILRPLIRTIQETRSAGVYLSTFCRSRLSVDNRMRCMFDPAGTETFRYSSYENAFGSGGNLQNIPKGTEED